MTKDASGQGRARTYTRSEPEYLFGNIMSTPVRPAYGLGPLMQTPYADFFGCDIHFGEAVNEMRLHKRFWESVPPQANILSHCLRRIMANQGG